MGGARDEEVNPSRNALWASSRQLKVESERTFFLYGGREVKVRPGFAEDLRRRCTQAMGSAPADGPPQIQAGRFEA
jgi:hypothetical protein